MIFDLIKLRGLGFENSQLLKLFQYIRKLWVVLLFPTFVYCVELSPDISRQISGMLYGDLSLECSLSYPDTPENRKLVLTEIAKLYGRFLTTEAHEGPIWTRLRQKGMWIEPKYPHQLFPKTDEIDSFIVYLIQGMEGALLDDRYYEPSLSLGVDYGPDPGPLYDAFKKILPSNEYYSLLPYKTLTWIYIKDHNIKIALCLSGPYL